MNTVCLATTGFKCHGANVLHEVAAFGLTPCVLERVLREWREADRGGALAETLASFARCQLACVRRGARRGACSQAPQQQRRRLHERRSGGGCRSAHCHAHPARLHRRAHAPAARLGLPE